MRPKTKYQVIYRHRTEYPISVMCRFFGVSRSGYYDFVRRGDRPEKDKELADIIAMQRKRCWGTYGYRRMCLWLRGQNIYKNPMVHIQSLILHLRKCSILFADLGKFHVISFVGFYILEKVPLHWIF